MTTTVKLSRRIDSPQLLFGELVKLAFPQMEAFHSDLYHDAMWCKNFFELAKKQGYFYYLVSEAHTHLSFYDFLYGSGAKVYIIEFSERKYTEIEFSE